MRKNQSLKEGFEKHVIRNSEGCWDWNGCAPDPGYPQFQGDGYLIRAHRASWIIHFGVIPKGMFVCHKCDNRICTNPEHLFLGTCNDNNIDMLKKGRSPVLGKYGRENPYCKLTDQEVKEIRERANSGERQRLIAQAYGISQTHVSQLKRLVRR